MLLLFNSKSGLGNYPGKIFEYFAAQRTILAFGPKDSDTQNLILETNSGLYFTYEEKDFKQEVLELYKQKEGLRIKDLDKFSREKLTDKLSDLLDKL